MKSNSRSILILTILFGYILLQFISWEILFVRKTNEIIDLKQKLVALSTSDPVKLNSELAALQEKKQKQVIMIVGEGTVFLLLLLFGIYKIRQAHTKEIALTSQQKNFFLSITHELKTPIAATKLQLQTLRKHRLNEDMQKELIANALSETERLNTLIDNVLLASRFDSTEYSFKKERQNISTLTQEVVMRYFKNEIAKGEVKINVEENLFSEVDLTAYPSILTNLIENTIKYSFDERNVQVDLYHSGNFNILKVSDQGAGISETDKANIFTKFYRAGNEDTRRTKGTGLGLYIVNYLVKQHKATIQVKNNQPKGSIFEVRFNAL